MSDKLRTPYVVMKTDFGFKSGFDHGSADGANISEGFAKIFGYPVFYRGVVHDLAEFEAVADGVNYANKSFEAGRFNPRVLEEILPNLSSKPAVFR